MPSDSEARPEAIVRALQLLNRREHSRGELQTRLLREGYDASEIGKALDALEARQQLSDGRFAEALVHDREARWGNQRLAHELRRRGVSDTIIAQALAQARDDEPARCRAIWLRKFGTPPATLAEKGKQMRFLASRGFSSSAISKVLSGGFSQEDDAPV